MARRSYQCPGSGRRTSPTGSTAFPEVKCPECHYYASPVARYGEHHIRSHRPVLTDPYAEDGPTCECGQWPVAEYGPRCPSCPKERCSVCGGLNPGDMSHTRCQ